MAVFSRLVPLVFVIFKFLGRVIPGTKDKVSVDAYTKIASGQ